MRLSKFNVNNRQMAIASIQHKRCAINNHCKRYQCKRCIIYKIYKYLGLVPIIWIIAVITYYLGVALIIGHFPTYNNPDPKNLDNESIKIIGSLVFALFFFTLYCSYAFLGIFIIHLIYTLIKKKEIHIEKIIISASGFLLLIVMILLPGLKHILEWLID